MLLDSAPYLMRGFAWLALSRLRSLSSLCVRTRSFPLSLPLVPSSSLLSHTHLNRSPAELIALIEVAHHSAYHTHVVQGLCIVRLDLKGFAVEGWGQQRARRQARVSETWQEMATQQTKIRSATQAREHEQHNT